MTIHETLTKYPYLHDPGICTYATGPDALWTDHCPVGWRPLLFEMCDKINELLEKAKLDIKNFEVLQIKEKFGALTFYWRLHNGTKELSDQIHAIIEDGRTRSQKICFLCGSPAPWISKPWVCPYCDKCAQEHVDGLNHRYGEGSTIENTFDKNEELR